MDLNRSGRGTVQLPLFQRWRLRCSMLTTRTFTALSWILALGLCAWSVHLSWSRPDVRSVSGHYRLEHPWTLRAVEIPDRIELSADGTLRVHGTDGTFRTEGRWWWDEQEAWVRSDAPGMDRRIRGYVDQTGTRLLYRVDEQPNRAEEVRLHRAS